PASRAGRRVEKNVFPKIAGVKPLYPSKVKESRAKQVFRKAKIGWSKDWLVSCRIRCFGGESGHENHPSPLFRIALGGRRFGRFARMDLQQHENLCRPALGPFRWNAIL